MRNASEATSAVADVVLCFSADGEGAAGLLAPRLAARGYRIWSEDRADAAPITERIAAVRAAIVLWSDGSRASEWVKAEANFARGQCKLVQAALDGAPPPLPFDPRAVIPLAAWTGEEDHPGWRRIIGELERLAPKPAATPASTTAAVAKPERSAAPASAAGPARGRGGLSVAALLFLLAVAAGAFLWMRSGPPYGNATEPAAQTAAPAPRTAPPAIPPPSAFPPADLTSELPGTAEPPPEPVEASPEPGRTNSQPPPRPTGPRINRRNSENMRLFCERAGRGTPQCRDFQRRLRRQGR